MSTPHQRLVRPGRPRSLQSKVSRNDAVPMYLLNLQVREVILAIVKSSERLDDPRVYERRLKPVMMPTIYRSVH